MTNLIGLGGYAYAGKDAFADVLEKNLGWYKTYMSKALRESLEVLNPIIDMDFYTGSVKITRFKDIVDLLGYEKAKENREVRALLQRMGTEVGRKMFSEDFWLDLCFKDAVKQLEAGRNVVITGIRYPNELFAIQSLSGTSVWITRPENHAVNEHSSDNSLTPEDFDYTFKNEGTLEDLETTVPEFLKSLGFWDAYTVSYKDMK